MSIKQYSTFIFILIILYVCGYSQVKPDAQSGKPSLIEEIKKQRSGISIWWTGHNGWLIKADTLLIATDLAVENKDRINKAPVSALELAGELDISFITHEHGDHFNRETSRILAEKSKCLFVMPNNCVQEAQKIGISLDRIKIASPRKPFELRGIKVDPIRAIHGNPKFAVFYDANLEDCGYLIQIGDKKLLQPGDTVLLEDHLYLKHVDVLFFSPTEHNMHIDPSVLLINELEPDLILPQHRATYKVTPQNRYWTTGYPHEVKMRLSRELQKRYYVLEIGDRIDL